MNRSMCRMHRRRDPNRRNESAFESSFQVSYWSPQSTWDPIRNVWEDGLLSLSSPVRSEKKCGREFHLEELLHKLCCRKWGSLAVLEHTWSAVDAAFPGGSSSQISPPWPVSNPSCCPEPRTKRLPHRAFLMHIYHNVHYGELEHPKYDRIKRRN